MSKIISTLLTNNVMCFAEWISVAIVIIPANMKIDWVFKIGWTHSW